MSESRRIRIIDLFAGPGGLGEGFSRVAGKLSFEIALSIEMERHAHRTLQLRAAYRLLREQNRLDEYYAYIRGEITEKAFRDTPWVQDAFEVAEDEAIRLELGPESREFALGRIKSALGSTGNWVLIGGPPCQAYSLVGRARNTNSEDFHLDTRHFLYREYLEVLETFQPAVFVMENVKGLLSANTTGRNMFQAIRRDLTGAGGPGNYRIFSVVTSGNNPEPRDFVVRSEDYGVPQARHRVILLGVRSDIHRKAGDPAVLMPAERRVSVSDMLGGMPVLRSRLSREDSQEDWIRTLHRTVERLRELQDNGDYADILTGMEDALVAVDSREELASGQQFLQAQAGTIDSPDLARFMEDPRIGGVLQHETRSHMPSDIKRYLFISTWAQRRGHSPRVQELPGFLRPRHANISRRSVPFADRFRTQLASEPANTIVAHMSKDGHAFIHYDPAQARSLTVREAARLQTFPDNYFFQGPRTTQYTQVGNAVPPYLAFQIAGIVADLLDKAA